MPGRAETRSSDTVSRRPLIWLYAYENGLPREAAWQADALASLPELLRRGCGPLRPRAGSDEDSPRTNPPGARKAGRSALTETERAALARGQKEGDRTGPPTQARAPGNSFTLN